MAKTVTLGSTGITVNFNGFGALPIQRVSVDEAVKIVRRAYDGGVRFFDTARYYSDSEIKLGIAFEGIRENVYIASKTGAENAEDFWKELNTTLNNLKTDYIDIYQFHNLPFVPKPGDGTGLYEAMLEAKNQGMIRHIGMTNHRLHLAHEIIDSGLYETLQFPFCYLANELEEELVKKCKEKNMGFIAMKGMSGGLITNSKAAYAYIYQYDNILPIWGVQKTEELDEFLSYDKNPPVLDDQLKSVIDKDREELSGEFCRACGYCVSMCPKGIEINACARMMIMLGRAPIEAWTTPHWQNKMKEAEGCIGCGKCKTKCPYNLDIPHLLKKNCKEYWEFLEERGIEKVVE